MSLENERGGAKSLILTNEGGQSFSFKTVCILSGGSIDSDKLKKIIELDY